MSTTPTESLEYERMIEDGRLRDAVLSLLNEGLVSNAVVDSLRFSDRLSTEDKRAIVAKLSSLHEDDHAFRLAMRWQIFRSLPASLQIALYAVRGTGST